MSCNLHRFDAFCVFAKRNLLALFVLILLISSVFSFTSYSLNKIKFLTKEKVILNKDLFSEIPVTEELILKIPLDEISLKKNSKKIADGIILNNSEIFFKVPLKDFYYFYPYVVGDKNNLEIEINGRPLENKFYRTKEKNIFVTIRSDKEAFIKGIYIVYKPFSGYFKSNLSFDISGSGSFDLSEFLLPGFSKEDFELSIDKIDDGLFCSINGFNLYCESYKKGTYTLSIEAHNTKLDFFSVFDIKINNIIEGESFSNYFDFLSSSITKPVGTSFSLDLYDFIFGDKKGIDFSLLYYDKDLLNCSLQDHFLNCDILAYAQQTIIKIEAKKGNYEKESDLVLNILPAGGIEVGDIPYFKPDSSQITINLLDYISSSSPLTFSIDSTFNITCSVNNSLLDCTAQSFSYAFVIIVADNGFDTTNIKIEFDFSEINQKPFLKTPLKSKSYFLGSNILHIDLSKYFIDPENDILTFSLDNNGNIPCSINNVFLDCDLSVYGHSDITIFANDGYNVSQSNVMHISTYKEGDIDFVYDGPTLVPTDYNVDYNIIVKNNLAFDLYSLDLNLSFEDQNFSYTLDSLPAFSSKKLSFNTTMPSTISDAVLSYGVAYLTQKEHIFNVRSPYESDSNLQESTYLTMWVDDADNDGNGDWTGLYYGKMKKLLAFNKYKFRIHAFNYFDVPFKTYLCYPGIKAKYGANLRFISPKGYLSYNFCDEVVLKPKEDNVFERWFYLDGNGIVEFLLYLSPHPIYNFFDDTKKYVKVYRSYFAIKVKDLPFFVPAFNFDEFSTPKAYSYLKPDTTYFLNLKGRNVMPFTLYNYHFCFLNYDNTMENGSFKILGNNCGDVDKVEPNEFVEHSFNIYVKKNPPKEIPITPVYNIVFKNYNYKKDYFFDELEPAGGIMYFPDIPISEG